MNQQIDEAKNIPHPILLASGSPRRAKILTNLGISFKIVKTDVPEVCYEDDPERTVRENARAKAGAITPAQRQSFAGVLSADTIVWYNGRIYGKPCDDREAKVFLQTLSGNTHTVFTGVCFNGDVRVVRSDVTFRVLDERTIDAYIECVHPTDRAGAYDIDASGDLLVAGWTGSYENIMGLPIEPLREWLAL